MDSVERGKPVSEISLWWRSFTPVPQAGSLRVLVFLRISSGTGRQSVVGGAGDELWPADCR